MDVETWEVWTLVGSLVAAVAAVAALGFAVFVFIRDRNREAPGGVFLNLHKDPFVTDGFRDARVSLSPIGSWEMYEPEVSLDGAEFLEKPEDVRVLSIRDEPLEFEVRFPGRPSDGRAKVEVAWVANQSRSTTPTRMRFDLHSGEYEDWVRYRLRLGRRAVGRWVARKSVREAD